jgi:hypothetical protein
MVWLEGSISIIKHPPSCLRNTAPNNYQFQCDQLKEMEH